MFADPRTAEQSANVAPRSFAPTPNTRERAQQYELEAAVYQASMTPQWSFEDAFFRHVNTCFDSDCDICRPHASNDHLF